MKTKTLKGFAAKTISILLIPVFFAGCASSTKMTVNVFEPNGSPVVDATVFVDGEVIGQTPNARVKVSNFVGNNFEITVLKDGYETVKTAPVKEVKQTNVVSGILLNFFAWLWVYGPKSNQSIILTPETGY